MNARYWIALHSIARVGAATCRRLFETLGGAEAIFRSSPEALAGAGVRSEAIREAFERRREAGREVERAAALGIELVSIEDDGYPKALRYLYDPPPVLYVKGRIEPRDVEAVAIVGSRSASAYGVATAERLAGELAPAGVTVVSGLAIGIDAAAHRGALSAGGRTIAVLGSGVDRVYPRRHERLAAEVAEAGAIVSELPLGTPPLAGHFPRRNRIVSGLSLGVVVVEANERSGSLITARLALEQGREVLAVPGEACLDRTRGTHRLLRQGACLVETGADVLEAVAPWRVRPAFRSSPEPPCGDAARVLAAFENVTEHVDQLIARSGLDAARALEVLLELELGGRVRRHSGMIFSKRIG